jgi:hypothetical protein
MNRALIHELATGRFIAQREDALFLSLTLLEELADGRSTGDTRFWSLAETPQ